MGSQQNYVLSYLEIHRKGQNIYVENKTNGDVFEINEAAAEVIQYMQKGVPLAEIQVRVAPKYPDEEIDVFDFVKQLKELGLVQSDADAAVKEQDQGALKNKWDNIPVNVAKLLFNPYAYTIYILLFVRNLSLFFIHPHLIPNYHDVFISPSITISYIFWFIISTFVVLFHEFGHILAARAYDLSPRLSVGYRLFYIVMETDLGRIWKLPSKARNVPFLGGICFDQIMLCAALTVQLWAPYTFWAVVGKVVAFHIFLTLIFQCLIFMKTDLYFVFENAWSTHNLQDNARNQLARFIPFMKKDKETNVFAGGRTGIAFIFSYLCGWFDWDGCIICTVLYSSNHIWIRSGDPALAFIPSYDVVLGWSIFIRRPAFDYCITHFFMDKRQKNNRIKAVI